MNAHPAAELFPTLSEPELKDLAEDIKANGQRLPITLWKGKDLLLDGRNREAAARLAGVEPVYEEKDFPDDAAAVRFIVSVNLKRRHLDESQRAMIASRLATLPAHRPGKGGKFSGLSQEEAAQLLNVSDRSIRSARKVLGSGDSSLVAAVNAGEVAVSRAAVLAALPESERRSILRDGRLIKGLRRRESLRQREERALSAIAANHPFDGRGYRLIHGDILESEISDSSVAAIITDPPYAEVECYEKLAKFAARVLKPGGSLLAMTGGMHLPSVLDALRGSGLAYWWTITYATPGHSTVLAHHRVFSNAKQILWFAKGAYVGESVCDLVESGPREKGLHDWQQTEDGFGELVEKLTVRGELVCDPFLGSGTTGVAAVRRGRLFVGIDVDAKAVAIAAERMAKERPS